PPCPTLVLRVLQSFSSEFGAFRLPTRNWATPNSKYFHSRPRRFRLRRAEGRLHKPRIVERQGRHTLELRDESRYPYSPNARDCEHVHQRVRSADERERRIKCRRHQPEHVDQADEHQSRRERGKHPHPLLDGPVEKENKRHGEMKEDQKQ